MRLDFMMLADAAQVDESGKLNVTGGGATHMSVPSLPFQLPSLAIVARFFVDPEDVGVDHRLSFSVRDPAGIENARAGGALPRPGRLEAHPGESPTLIVVGTFENLTFAAPGSYSIAMYLDDELVEKRSIVVVEGEAQVVEHTLPWPTPER